MFYSCYILMRTVMQTVAPLCIPAASAWVVGALLHPRCLLSDGDISLSSLMSLSAVSPNGLLDATSCQFKWIEIGSKKTKQNTTIMFEIDIAKGSGLHHSLE